MLANIRFLPQSCLAVVIDFVILSASLHGHTESVPSFCFASRWCCPIRIAVDGTNNRKKNSNRTAEGDYLCVFMLNVKCKITRRTLRPRDFESASDCSVQTHTHTNQVNIICKRKARSQQQSASDKRNNINAI